MNAIQQIKAILEGAGRRVYYIRDAVFTASWLVQNCEFPAVLLFERRLRQFQHEGVGSWRELCECKMVCVTTTAYEFQTPENDAIQETQTTEAMSLCSLLRQSQMFDRFEVGQALAVYDGAVGVLLTGCSVDLTASTLAGECGTPPDAGKIITENGRTDVLGLSWVEVNVQGGTPAVVEPLAVEPTNEAQTFNPPAGVDGFAPVVVGACPVCPAPVLQAKTAEPATIAQVVTADEGFDGLSSVTVDAVTAAIDANIVAGNIKKDVEILGVTGTLELMPEGDEIDISYDGGQTFHTFVSTGTPALASGLSCLKLVLKGATELNRTTYNIGMLCPKILIAVNATSVTNYALANNLLTDVTVGTVTAWSQVFGNTTMINLRKVEVGQGTAINIPMTRWTATNVIGEGQSGIDELNYNIKTYLADRVADRTGLSALTVSFGASLYNVLTADTIAAFTAKNWNVASA